MTLFDQNVVWFVFCLDVLENRVDKMRTPAVHLGAMLEGGLPCRRCPTYLYLAKAISRDARGWLRWLRLRLTRLLLLLLLRIGLPWLSGCGCGCWLRLRRRLPPTATTIIRLTGCRLSSWLDTEVRPRPGCPTTTVSSCPWLPISATDVPNREIARCPCGWNG